MAIQIQVRRGTAADWTSNNPILEQSSKNWKASNTFKKQQAEERELLYPQSVRNEYANSDGRKQPQEQYSYDHIFLILKFYAKIQM